MNNTTKLSTSCETKVEPVARSHNHLFPVRSEERRVGKECSPRRWENHNVEYRPKYVERGPAYIHQCRFFISSRRRHTRFDCDWSSDVCSSDLVGEANGNDLLIGEDPIKGDE